MLTWDELCSMQAILSNGQAVFLIEPVDHSMAALNELGGLLNVKGAKLGKLAPGLHSATATYHGDGTYAPCHSRTGDLPQPLPPF